MSTQRVNKKWFLVGLIFWSAIGVSGDHLPTAVRQTQAFPIGSEDTFYRFGDDDTKSPSRRIFTEGTVKQTAAQKFNKGLYKETVEILREAGIEDQELLNSIDQSAPYVTITLNGIGFRRVPDNADEVQLILVTSNRHIVLKTPISLRQLASGKKIIVDDTLSKSKFGMKLASINHLELSFDRNTGLLNIHEFKSVFSGKVLGMGPSEAAQFTNLVGKVGELKLPPEEKPD